MHYDYIVFALSYESVGCSPPVLCSRCNCCYSSVTEAGKQGRNNSCRAIARGLQQLIEDTNSKIADTITRKIFVCDKSYFSVKKCRAIFSEIGSEAL